MTDIYHNGKRLSRIDLTFDAQAAPIIAPQPLVEAKPPVRPADPPANDTPPAGAVPDHVIARSYGPLLRNNPRLQVVLRLGKVHSYGFWVPANTKVRLVNFGFVPQNKSMTQMAVWISEEPGGESLDERYALDAQVTRVGGQLQVTAAIRGRGGERRGAMIEVGKRYYINMQAGGNVPMEWRITGDF
jgi:hypothetical protein